MGGIGSKTTYGAYSESSGHFNSDFTKDEIKDIRLLTGGTINSVSAPEKMNKQLRKYGPVGLTQAGERIMKNLDSALSKYTTDSNITLYRGGSADLLGGYSTLSDIQKLIGKTVQDNGFMSTSTESVGSFGHYPIHYKLQIPSGSQVGAPVSSVSKHPNENEFLLSRRPQFKVKSAKQSDNKIVVTLQYIGKGNTDIEKDYYKTWLDSQ